MQRLEFLKIYVIFFISVLYVIFISNPTPSVALVWFLFPAICKCVISNKIFCPLQTLYCLYKISSQLTQQRFGSDNVTNGQSYCRIYISMNFIKIKPKQFYWRNSVSHFRHSHHFLPVALVILLFFVFFSFVDSWPDKKKV